MADFYVMSCGDLPTARIAATNAQDAASQAATALGIQAGRLALIPVNAVRYMDIAVTAPQITATPVADSP